MIRVALFDDSREQRDGLTALLESVDKVTCVGSFADAMNAERDVEISSPEVVLMDIDMPGMDGIEACARLRLCCPELRILMLTVVEDEDRIFAAIRAGACSADAATAGDGSGHNRTGQHRHHAERL